MNKFLQQISTQIIENGNRNAFFINESYYSYSDFGTRITSIRNLIHDIEDKILCIAIHDDIETYASILALWMEGKGYVPLHPNQPLDRNINIIEQVNANIILDSSEHSAFENWGIDKRKKTLCTKNLHCTSNIKYYEELASEDDIAYILFTSGSTGIPKGVQITRGNVSAFLDSFWKTGIEITENDRCMQLFDLTFDVSIQSFIVALIKGACVYTVPYGHVKYLYAASLIQKQRITFGAMAPSMLTYLRPYFDEFDASSLRISILTAEACPIDLIKDWFKCAKNTEIYDFYGPTEATIYCTYYKLSREKDNLSLNGIVSIGKPLANIEAIIIDEAGNIINGSTKGELCVAGAQVTSGYWNNPEKNSSSFFVNNDTKYYHTGDLCYWDESGNIMYSGRIDQQAKIQGFRVELGEIEFHARNFYNNEKRVIAIAFQNVLNLTEIALFIEALEDRKDELIIYLKSKMPQYMIPTKIVFVEDFPLNKSEKIDRIALKGLI